MINEYVGGVMSNNAPKHNKAIDWLFRRSPEIEQASKAPTPNPEESMEDTLKNNSRGLSEEILKIQRKNWGPKK